MRILVVEPDQVIAQSIELMLKSQSFNVYTTDLGEEAIDLSKLYDYDVIVLEIALRDVSGYTVIKRLRDGKVSTPILICSGVGDIESIVKGLDLGADDYMTKPFHKDELVARIHAIVRRSKGHPVSIITTGNLAVNISTKTVAVNGRQIHFTSKEYAILELLSLRKGMTISKEMLLNHLYGGMDEPEIKIIDVFICKIRKKLRAAKGHDVKTVWGRGYMMCDPLLPSVPSPSLAPEMRDMMDDPPTGFVSRRSFLDKRREDIAAGKVKAPSIVPAKGQR